MKILFLFLDGVGLGLNNPDINPLASTPMPHLQSLLGDQRLLLDVSPFDGPRASLRALDAGLGVPGLPQSATGQAVLLTGINVPASIGEHYGPKPNPAVAEFVRNGNLFHRLQSKGCRTDFLNAYPPRYFEGINSKKRIYSAIPMAAVSAGHNLHTLEDMIAGKAISADFTAQGWNQHLGFKDVPVKSPHDAGLHLAELASRFEFSFFEYWASDYAGHKQVMRQAVELMRIFDEVIGGLLNAWDDSQGLILITSDHGNIEDLSTRRHTDNPVPALVIGEENARQSFLEEMEDLCDVAPAIEKVLTT